MNLLPHSLGYMLAPMTVCVGITGLLTYLGTHVLRREVIFVDLALAQIAALGATYAFYLGHDPMSTMAYFYSLGFTCLGAAVFSVTRHQKQKVPQEAIIGISYAVAAGAAILLVDLAHDPHGGEKIQYLLVGNLVWVTWWEVGKTTAVCAAVGLFHFVFRRHFALVTFHPEEAEAGGIPLRLWDFLFYLSFGVAITSIVRVTGVLLIFSYLIIPATIGTLYSDRIRGRLFIGWAVGLGVSFFGLLFSYDRPSGPTIVSIFGICLVFFGAVRFFLTSSDKKRSLAILTGGAVALLLLLAGLPALTSTQTHEPGHLQEEHEEHEGDALSALDHGSPGESKAETGSARPDPLENLKSPDPLVRESAADSLSGSKDAETLTALSAALETETDDGLKLKLAVILQHQSRQEGTAALVGLLRQSEIPFIRMEALDHLKYAAGETFGYEPEKTPAENVLALQHWEAWLKKQGEAN